MQTKGCQNEIKAIENMGKRKGMGGHQAAHSFTTSWLTPPDLIKNLGKPFSLDPSIPEQGMPWEIADTCFKPSDDGLKQDWSDHGLVFCNPPYDKVGEFLSKCVSHGNAIALTFARTETRNFFNHVWPHATAVKFLEGRLYFHYPDGTRAKMNGGAPSVLIAYGLEAAQRIANPEIKGKLLKINDRQIKLDL